MGKGHWTPEQWEAITARGSNLLVAAAAGAGKTAVLVERILRRITQREEPVDVDRLLVVTFTNAAAAEMRERIAAALARALKENPRSRHLQRQLTLLNRAAISTLHSFCLELVRQHFYRLDLDPGFRIADDTEAALLRLEVLEELFESYYEENHEDFLALVECYGGQRDDGPLQDLVLDLDRFSRSQPWPQRWLKKAVAAFSSSSERDLDSLPWTRELKREILLTLKQAEKYLEQALSLCGRPGGPAVYEETLRQELVMVQELQAGCALSWEGMYHVFQGLEFDRLKRCGREVEEQLKKAVTDLRDETKKILNKLKETYFQRSPQDYLEDLERLAPLMDFLTQLVSHFQEAYWQVKQKRGLVDFNDLEHLALKLLLAEEATPENPLPSPLALELRERFVEVLVDEYQDINGVQETILRLISRQGTSAPNLFMVGDVKQSIYRFRLAEPGLFLEKYETYERDPSLGRRIDLAKNFRSRQEVVAGTNFIFRQIMTPELGELAYDAKAELVYGALYPEEKEENSVAGPVELHLIDRKTSEGEENPASHLEGEEGEDQEEDLDSTQLEARVIGRCIKKLLGEGQGEPYQVYDAKAKTYRPVTYRDMVILLRATQNSSAVYLEEFRQMGIPLYADMAGGYLEAPEVETMLSLLKIIDNPQQDIPLAAVLRSPLWGVGQGLNAQQLGEIRLCCPQGSFYRAVLEKAKQHDELGQKLTDFLERLEKWRTQARRGPLADLIWTIYRETGFYDYVGAMPGGIQRQANLRALHDRARQYEKTTYRGLFRFLRFIEKLESSGSDLGTARALGENENVVRLMSIHKSKGLEFPVVFVAGLGKKFNCRDLSKDLLLHKELGLGPNVVDPKVRLSFPSLPKLAVKNRLKQELLAEELRILYVAMTRAREKLFLIGSHNDLQKAVERWCQLGAEAEGITLASDTLTRAQRNLDWIVPALSRHEQGGKALRELAGKGGSLLTDPSTWQVVFWEKQELQKLSPTPETLEEIWDKVKSLEPVAVDLEPAISHRLSWVYPQKPLAEITAKLTVSELKGRFDPEFALREDNLLPPVVERPKFMRQQGELTGAEKGIALHLFMQHLDLKKQYTLEELKALLDRLEAREILTPQQREGIQLEQVERFLLSPLGQRLREAQAIYKELPFSLMLPAQEVYPQLENCQEQVLVQGVIDCLAQENGGFVLVDYKTDWVTDDGVDKIVARYRGQLNLYALAVEKIYQQPVKDKYLFLLQLGEAVKV